MNTNKFSFASIGHFWATVLHDFKVGVSALQKAEPTMLKVTDEATAAASLVSPAAAAIATTVDRAAHAILGDAIAAANNTENAASANGVNLTLDQATVASLKQLAADLKSIGSAPTVPAGIPVTAA